MCAKLESPFIVAKASKSSCKNWKTASMFVVGFSSSSSTAPVGEVEQCHLANTPLGAIKSYTLNQ